MAKTDSLQGSLDLLVLKMLLLIGTMPQSWREFRPTTVRWWREDFSAGLSTLLKADQLLYADRYHTVILDCFARRGIDTEVAASSPLLDGHSHPRRRYEFQPVQEPLARVRRPAH